MSKKHQVAFVAHKPVKESVIVDFRTKAGREITFPAHKVEKEPVLVTFMATN